MTNGFIGILVLLTVMLTVNGWLARMQVSERMRRNPSRPFSLPRDREEIAGRELELPPTNWPEWATGRMAANFAQHSDLDEGISVDQVPPSTQPSAPDLAMDVFEPLSQGDHDQIASELVRGFIWSEILQPPQIGRASCRVRV